MGPFWASRLDYQGLGFLDDALAVNDANADACEDPQEAMDSRAQLRLSPDSGDDDEEEEMGAEEGLENGTVAVKSGEEGDGAGAVGSRGEGKPKANEGKAQQKAVFVTEVLLEGGVLVFVPSMTDFEERIEAVMETFVETVSSNVRLLGNAELAAYTDLYDADSDVHDAATVADNVLNDDAFQVSLVSRLQK